MLTEPCRVAAPRRHTDSVPPSPAIAARPRHGLSARQRARRWHAWSARAARSQGRVLTGGRAHGQARPADARGAEHARSGRAPAGRFPTAESWDRHTSAKPRARTEDSISRGAQARPRRSANSRASSASTSRSPPGANARPATPTPTHGAPPPSSCLTAPSLQAAAEVAPQRTLCLALE